MEAQAKRRHARKSTEITRVFNTSEELGKEMSKRLIESLMASFQLSLTTDANKR
jgi:hypothetical protein